MLQQTAAAHEMAVGVSHIQQAIKLASDAEEPILDIAEQMLTADNLSEHQHSEVLPRLTGLAHSVSAPEVMLTSYFEVMYINLETRRDRP